MFLHPRWIRRMETVLKIVCIFFGGATGSLARFGVGKFFQHMLKLPSWMAIFFANMTGCVLIGIFFALLPREVHVATLDHPSACSQVLYQANLRIFAALLMTGFCGGFTTFSAFGLDTLILYYQRRYLTLSFYVLSSTFFGLVAVAGGLWLAEFL